MKTIKVVGYYRTSGKTELQNKGFGLQTQKSEVRKMIKDNGWDLVGEYTDDGVSGTSVDRPQFQQLLIENGFDYICVYSVDRLWRDEISCSIIKHELKKMEKDVKSVREQNYSLYDENPSDFLMNRF
jgi:site-specific DNA recombinase